MSSSAPEGFPNRDVPFEHIAVVEGGYFDNRPTPDPNIDDVIVTRFGDIAFFVDGIDEEGQLVVGYDRPNEKVRFKVSPQDVLDMEAYHDAVLRVNGRSDKAIVISDNGRTATIFDQEPMN